MTYSKSSKRERRQRERVMESSSSRGGGSSGGMEAVSTASLLEELDSTIHFGAPYLRTRVRECVWLWWERGRR